MLRNLVVSYFAYYVIIAVLSLATQSPYLVGGIVVLWLLRRYIPDPSAIFRSFGRLGSLKAQAEANSANVAVRRDLARTYLELRRPKRALIYLAQALERDPKSAELHYLMGLAKLRAGEAAGAIEPLIAAVELDARLLYGEPYRVAGEALLRLGRIEEAQDAFERFAEKNSSSI